MVKQIISAILLVFWMVITLLLVISIIGTIVVFDDETGWSDIPKSLISNFNKN